MFSYEKDIHEQLKKWCQILTPFPFISYRSYAINQFRLFAIKKGYINFLVCVGFFFGCLLSLVDHYLIKTLFILKIKTVNSKDKVYKNYNPYQIRPDTVDLVADYWIFHHFFCCIIITRSTAIFTRIAVFFNKDRALRNFYD